LQPHSSTINERKSYATRYPLPKPVALSQKLQTKSSHSNPAIREGEPRVPPIATLWFKAATGNRLVARKVFPRGHQPPADNRKTGARTEVLACRHDQPSLSELRLGEPFSPSG